MTCLSIVLESLQFCVSTLLLLGPTPHLICIHTIRKVTRSYSTFMFDIMIVETQCFALPPSNFLGRFSEFFVRDEDIFVIFCFFLSLSRARLVVVQTRNQAEGLWLGLVERALSEAELDLSFEALLGLRKETPRGWPMLARTFFQRLCSQPDVNWGRNQEEAHSRAT